jgi:hypothetical protein
MQGLVGIIPDSIIDEIFDIGEDIVKNFFNEARKAAKKEFPNFDRSYKRDVRDPILNYTRAKFKNLLLDL